MLDYLMTTTGAKAKGRAQTCNYKCFVDFTLHRMMAEGQQLESAVDSDGET